MKRLSTRAGLLLLGTSLAGPALLAQQPTLTAQVDATRVGVEDQVQLTITATGSGRESVPLPPLVNLSAVAGPYTSSQMSWVNGVTSQSRTWSWVLRPRGVGKASVGVVSLDLGSSKVSTMPIEIEVVKGSLGPSPQSDARRGRDPLDDPLADPFEDLFARRTRRGPEPSVRVEALASRTRLKVGESLVLEFVLDTQASISDLQMVGAPQFPGFWSEDLPKANEPPNGEAVVHDGQSYRRFRLVRKLLFPTRAGTLSVPRASFRMGFSREPFEAPRAPIERQTEPLSIQAEPLPPGVEAVGRFETKASLDRTSVALGEAVTLKLTISGRGNLKWVEAAPQLALPGAKLYPPQSKTELSVAENGLSGSRSWEWVVVPQTAGELQVPAMPFSYFDTETGQVVNKPTAPLSIQVHSEPGRAASSAAADLPRSTRAASPASWRSELDRAEGSPFLSRRGLGWWLLACALAHAGLWLSPRLASGWRGGARRSSRGTLGELQAAASGNGSKESVAGLIEKSLHEAFGELEPGDPRPFAEEARQLLAEVQFLRYAPQLGHYQETIGELARKCLELLRRHS